MPSNAAPPLPRVIAILQARTGSTRLPGKVLADLVGAPMLLRQVERIRRARLLDGLVIATSTDAADDPLAATAAAAGIRVFRGSLNDVLDRYAAAATAHPGRHVVRLTGDCPLADPDVIDAVIAHHLVTDADYTSNAHEPTLPDGLDVEVMRAEVLAIAATEGKGPVEREHVTPFVHRRPERFRIVHYKTPHDLSALRWTVDEPEDLAFVRAVYQRLYPTNPAFTMADILTLIAAHPEIAAINQGHVRNAGLAKSLAAESLAAAAALSAGAAAPTGA